MSALRDDGRHDRTGGAIGLLRVAALVLISAISAASCAMQQAARRPGLAPGDHTFTLLHDGATRQYIVHVPPSAGTGPVPLMVALHGGGGHAAQFQRENGMDAAADRHGFLVAYPDGTGPLSGRLLTWNAGEHCCGWALAHRIDDVGFLAAMLQDLKQRTGIDPKRVYVTGHSNGAIMAYRFAAERAELVTAVIPVAGAMDVGGFKPSRPVAVLHIHSVDDPRALYAGGLGPPFPGTQQRVQHQAAMAGIEQWARFNGCRLPPVEREARQGSGRDQGQSTTRLVYEGCGAGGAVEHLRLRGVGHGWPGTDARRWLRRILGPPTHLVDASEEAWAFASRHSR